MALCWSFPQTVRENLICWRGSFVRKKRQRVCFSIPICIFWVEWKEKNKIVSREGSSGVQKLKLSFVNNLWDSNKLYIGEECSTLLFFGVVGLNLKWKRVVFSFLSLLVLLVVL